ncbi:hypothetical protein GFS31_06220 [Leptolyngbya sp. BL0902]|nr:hypothetical protein GFS31_06220 [Leptolyngbya sp. BL0902]
MLLASLGLHGAVLMLPTGASDDSPIPPPDPEQDSVAMTRVLPTSSSEGEDPMAGQSPGEAVTPMAGTQPLNPAGVGVPAQRSPEVAPTAPRTVPQPRTVPRNLENVGQGQSSPNPAPPPSPAANRPQAGETESPRPSAPSPAAPPVPSDRPAPADSSNQNQTQALMASPRPPALAGNNLREQLQAHAARLNFSPSRLNRLTEALRERFSYNAVTSTEEAFATNYREWQTQIRQDTGIADLTAETLPDPVAVAYWQRACLNPAPGLVRVGLVVNPDGSHHGPPVLLQSSGYGAVDDWALSTLADQTLPTANQVSAYILTVEPSVEAGPNPCLAVTPST